MASRYLTPDNKHIFSTSQNGTVPKPTAEDANKYLKGDGTWSGGGGGGASNLADLDDVTISGIADKDSLEYDATEQKWKNVRQYQPKTLETHVYVQGQEKTTVDTAIVALAGFFNDLGLSIVNGEVCQTYIVEDNT